MAKGTVKWFNAEKGFGFITQDAGGPDVFVHYSSIDTTGKLSLSPGDQVEFVVAQGPTGLKADRVHRVSAAGPLPGPPAGGGGDRPPPKND